MAIAKDLGVVVPFFKQDCPFCGRSNRMVIKGIYRNGNKCEVYPDIGYSFCNCKSVFYTNFENVKIHTHSGIEHYEHPLKELKNIFDSTPSENLVTLTLPDPFFCEWGSDPYSFEYWNPRFYHVLFDMDQLCEDSKEIGFEIVSAKREFNPGSDRPKTMEIILRKP